MEAYSKRGFTAASFYRQDQFMVASKTASTRKKAGLGCGFTAMVGLSMIALLIVNGIVLDALLGNRFGENEARIIRPLLFVGSVVMIFFEYWIYDRVMGSLPSRRGS